MLRCPPLVGCAGLPLLFLRQYYRLLGYLRLATAVPRRAKLPRKVTRAADQWEPRFPMTFCQLASMPTDGSLSALAALAADSAAASSDWIL